MNSIDRMYKRASGIVKDSRRYVKINEHDYQDCVQEAVIGFLEADSEDDYIQAVRYARKYANAQYRERNRNHFKFYDYHSELKESELSYERKELAEKVRELIEDSEWPIYYNYIMGDITLTELGRRDGSNANLYYRRFKKIKNDILKALEKDVI